MTDPGPSDEPRTQPTGEALPSSEPPAPLEPPANPDAVLTTTVALSPLAAVAEDIRSASEASSNPSECLAIASNVEAGVYERGEGSLAKDLDRVGCPEGDRRAICSRAGVSGEVPPDEPQDIRERRGADPGRPRRPRRGDGAARGESR